MGCLLLTWFTLLYIYTYIHNIYIIHNVFAIVFKSKHKVYQIISLPKIWKTRNRFKFWRKTKSSVAGERWRIYVCAIGGCKEAGIAL